MRIYCIGFPSCTITHAHTHTHTPTHTHQWSLMLLLFFAYITSQTHTYIYIFKTETTIPQGDNPWGHLDNPTVNTHACAYKHSSSYCKLLSVFFSCSISYHQKCHVIYIYTYIHTYIHTYTGCLKENTADKYGHTKRRYN